MSNEKKVMNSNYADGVELEGEITYSITEKNIKKSELEINTLK